MLHRLPACLLAATLACGPTVSDEASPSASPSPSPAPSTSPSPAPSPAPSTSPSTSSSTSTPIPAATSAIDPADILGEAQAGIPFAQQRRYTAGVMGTYVEAENIPETGIQGPVLTNGETLRLGKLVDPTNASRTALAFQLAPSDPVTSSSHRSEIEFPPDVVHERAYWVAYSMYVYDWGSLGSNDDSLFGTQLHSGDTSRGLSPSFTVFTHGGATMRFAVMYSASSNPTPSNTVSVKFPPTSSPGIPIPFGRWADFVFKVKQSLGAGGYLQAWLDGVQRVDYHGPIGFDTPGHDDYFKFGYYNWSDFDSSRKVLLRSPVIVRDQTETKYRADDLRAYVQAR